MGQIDTGLRSIAMERARETAKIEHIYSEVTESVADEAVASASSMVAMESATDLMSDEALDELLQSLPEDALDEKEEIARIIGSEDNSIDIDDIVGVDEDIIEGDDDPVLDI